ncbi:MAG: AraC family transcriptional regulator [Desulforhopalus sp.]
MNPEQLDKLAALIDQHAECDGVTETAIPGVFCFKTSTKERLTSTVYEPSLCVVAQGYKQGMLNKEVFHYGPSNYLIVAVALPMVGQITKASKVEPYLALRIRIDMQQFSELLVNTGNAVYMNATAERGIFVGQADEAFSESVLRLARLMDSPEDIPVLAQQMKREVYYRLLRSDYGSTVAQIALKGSNMQRIASVIQKIQFSFQEPISMEEMADYAGMSTSSFHSHFKSVTSMSPLQFQKHLRLVEARRIMLVDSLDASSAAYHVGYESPSQFSREYTRMFGNPPGRDISLLKMKDAPQQTVAG